jgi:hypothetical protein
MLNLVNSLTLRLYRLLQCLVLVGSLAEPLSRLLMRLSICCAGFGDSGLLGAMENGSCRVEVVASKPESFPEALYGLIHNVREPDALGTWIHVAHMWALR